ncbi:MAG TPA: ester cyclase [Geodermatophilus sp.]|nr:ester cyclase [Geodermatophilus sp.]
MAAADKDVVRRWIEEMINQGRLEVADELCSPALAEHAKRWVAPFRASFPDVEMRIVTLVAEGDQVAGRFTCSATHAGPWLGHPPTGRRFEDVDEVYFFRLRDGRIVEMWGLEDTADRLRQLGLT